MVIDGGMLLWVYVNWVYFECLLCEVGLCEE